MAYDKLTGKFSIEKIRESEWFGKIDKGCILGVPMAIYDSYGSRWFGVWRVWVKTNKVKNGNHTLKAYDISNEDAEKLMTWKPSCNNQ